MKSKYRQRRRSEREEKETSSVSEEEEEEERALWKTSSGRLEAASVSPRLHNNRDAQNLRVLITHPAENNGRSEGRWTGAGEPTGNKSAERKEASNTPR